MMIPGYATPEGTQHYADRFKDSPSISTAHYRHLANGLVLSSLGMGSYLGSPTAKDDAALIQAVIRSVESGAINVIDTAINYRYQLSERAIGKAVAQLTEKGFGRDELFIASKNGFLAPDAESGLDPRAYLQETLIAPGILNPQDVAGSHAMTPRYLADQLERSRENLGLETIDLMYLHNAAESQLPVVGREEFMRRLRAAFAFYESARAANKIRFYGLATWNCFRVMPDQPEYLSLNDLVRLATEIGGEDHGFRFIQLPYNLAFTQALTLQSQPLENGEMASTLEAAMAFGIGVFTSVPLLQGQLLQQEALPSFEGLSTPAQSCLQFVRSHPGIIAPLVGHKTPENVADNLSVAKQAPLSFETLQQRLSAIA